MPWLAVTGRVSDWLRDPTGRLPVSCTVRAVENNWADLLDSLVFTSTALRYAAGVAVNLERVHPRTLIHPTPHPLEIVTHPVTDADPRIPVLRVEDSMETEHPAPGSAGIQESWVWLGQMGLESPVLLDLSALRPAGTVNQRGLVASGPESFAEIYQALHGYMRDPSLSNLLKVYSTINGTLRRGGTYKNGAITVHLNWDHPDILEYLTQDPAETPWIKRALTVTDGILGSPYLDLILARVADGSLWLNKATYDRRNERVYGNVCVTGDTTVQTDKGPRRVRDLVGTQFTAWVNGQVGQSTEQGFWCNGHKPTVRVSTNRGFWIECTPDHRLLVQPIRRRGKTNYRLEPEWKEAGQIRKGERLILSSPVQTTWEGQGSFSEGWLLGILLGDGSISEDGSQTALVRFWGQSKVQLLGRAKSFLKPLCLRARASRLSREEKEERKLVAVSSRGLARLAQKYGLGKDKKLNDKLESLSSDFWKGLIQGYFDTNGCVSLGQPDGRGRSLQIVSATLSNLEMVSRILLRLGILSTVRKDIVKPSYRLDISGEENICRFAEEIGSAKPEHQQKLQKLLGLYHGDLRNRTYWEAKVTEVRDAGIQEVYDCTIEGIHQFEANGFVAHNCQEIYLRSRGSCLLAHLNLGRLTAEEIPSAYEQAMDWLCRLHQITGVGESGIYLDPSEDKQVGLGVLGLASHLAINGIKYKDFATALTVVARGLDPSPSLEDSPAYHLALSFKQGIQRAADVAREYGMERAFTIAPTASCSYRYTDAEGWATTPEISPPLNSEVERDSETFGVQTYDYHPNVEIAGRDVDWPTYFQLCCAFQQLFDEQGLGHAISMNLWSPGASCDRAWLERFLAAPVRSTYYRLPVGQNLAKDRIQSCGLNESDCLSCAE